MQRFALGCFLVFFGGPVTVAPAQEPVAPPMAAKDPVAPVRQWLRDTAAGGPTAFTVRWQPMGSPAGGRGGEVQEATGTFAPDVLQVTAKQSYLQVGRHTLVREADRPWRLTRGGPELQDPPLLLRALAAELTSVAARTIVERDGAAVEQVTICLTPAQAERLVDAGAVGELSGARLAQGLVRSGRITAADVPVPTVDVCLEVDVTTRQLRRLYLRSLSSRVDMAQLLRNPPGARQAAGGAAAAAEGTTPAASAVPAVPTEFKDGLPVREEAGKTVVWVELVLRDHGRAPAVMLDAAQRALLGR